MSGEKNSSAASGAVVEAPAATPPSFPLPYEVEEPQSVFDKEKYRRARMHFGSLGDVKKSDAFRNYKRSWLTPFFGSNVPEPILEVEKDTHPCKLFSNEVHYCLREKNNDFHLCQTRVAAFQQCLKEFNM